MPGKRLYVRCKVARGLFESEFYVSVQRSSAFVDRSQVQVAVPPDQGNEVDGLVVAYFVGEDQRAGQTLVELPGQPAVGGLRTWVPAGLLANA